MKHLPYEIKLTYIIAIIVMMCFVCFIVFVVLMYNRKQLLYIKEKQLKEVEHQNEILQKELEKQKIVEKERERISHDMHDDLGAGISALKLQAEFMKQKAGENEELKNDINELLKTSEEMNLSMREMLWSLNTKNDTLFDFVQYSTIYAENFFKKSTIRLETENYVFENHEIKSDVRRNLFLCLKEAINNIYKHSKAQNVKIAFTFEGGVFLMEISDDGIGISENASKGNGLRNMQNRIEENCGRFEISPLEKGTMLKFSINF